MIRCAVLDPDGIVVNLVDYEAIPVGDVPGFPPGHTAMAAGNAQIGWQLVDGVLVDPSPPLPAMDYQTLYDAVSDVCPIESLTMGDPTDRSTWSFVPAPGATPAQIAAAQNVIATIPIEPQPIIATTEFVARFTNAEYRAADAAAWRQSGGNGKNWDILITADTIKLDRKKAQTVKTSLVEAGVLTVRAPTKYFPFDAKTGVNALLFEVAHAR